MTTQSQGENKQKEDYYHILGVSRTATDQQIKRAYEELIRTLHAEQSSDGSAKLQEIEKAYKVLGNPRLRSTYDFLGARAPEMMDRYQDDSGRLDQLSTCDKILYGILCCLTCCGCGCGCCCLCFGCCCCCDFFCNHCCGLCKRRNASVTPVKQKDSTSAPPQQQLTDSTKY